MPEAGPSSAATRRLNAAAAGHRGDEEEARRALADPDPGVRSAALGSLTRLGTQSAGDIEAGLSDPDPGVRRRAAQEAAHLSRDQADRVVPSLVGAVGDDDPLVVEMTCWSLGELAVAAAVDVLSKTATGHRDARCRESAVAALGALAAAGVQRGLPAVLAALEDRPTVRRRAVVALAGFDGPEVEAALRRSLEDRDWQVRQAAEILLDP